MKKILIFILGLIVSFGISSCGNKNEHKDKFKDSTFVLDVIESFENPTFTSTAEILAYRDLCVEQQSIDSTFLTMPDHLFEMISNICINKYGNVTKKSLVLEYLDHKSEVYNYIHEPKKNGIKYKDSLIDDTILTLPD